MKVKNSARRYGLVAMTLHWIIALLILANIALGFYFNEIMDRQDLARLGIIQTHKSIGLTVLMLSLVRLGWRLINPVPALPADMSAGAKLLAHVTHYLLYFLMITIPLLGWMVASAARTGLPTFYFGTFGWPNISFIADLPRAQKIVYGRLFGDAHIILAYSALILALGHIGAALYHNFVRRDAVLKHMLPGASA